DFTNFKEQVGPEKFDDIFHLLVEVVKRVGLVSGKILSYDGTLFPTFANYKGCNYACKSCRSIPLKEDFLKSLRYRIINSLNHPSKISLGKERRSFAICPRDDLPSCVKKRPTFAALSFCFIPKEEEQRQSELAYILGLEKRLSQQGLYLKLLSSCISKIDLTKDEPLIYVNCPRVPADLEAKIGYRRSNHNPNRKVKVFGYQAMITTNIELEIGLELPVGCKVTSADKLDGSYLIPEREKLIQNHGFLPYLDIADSGFDIEKNFHRIRSTSSIPVIDYNKRGERTDIETLKMRGYDDRGIPFAPCLALCKSNGYDEKKKRLSFVCRKQCLTSPRAVPNPVEACKYLSNECGYSTHVSIKAHPRLICEVPRCSDRWKKIRNLRSASERSNGTTKSSDLDILESPRIYGLAMASIEATMACITTLLKRMMRFVIGITVNLMRYLKTWKRSYKNKLAAPNVPTFILSLIQRKRSPPRH
ncbi:MAG: transposase, partial [bacterium]